MLVPCVRGCFQCSTSLCTFFNSTRAAHKNNDEKLKLFRVRKYLTVVFWVVLGIRTTWGTSYCDVFSQSTFVFSTNFSVSLSLSPALAGACSFLSLYERTAVVWQTRSLCVSLCSNSILLPEQQWSDLLYASPLNATLYLKKIMWICVK